MNLNWQFMVELLTAVGLTSVVTFEMQSAKTPSNTLHEPHGHLDAVLQRGAFAQG